MFANMKLVEKLLSTIPDWDKVVVPRHVKFVNSYITNKGNLKRTGDQFSFTEKDMLSIFWRIQRSLQAEYDKRVKEGRITPSPRTVFVVDINDSSNQTGKSFKETITNLVNDAVNKFTGTISVGPTKIIANLQNPTVIPTLPAAPKAPAAPQIVTADGPVGNLGDLIAMANQIENLNEILTPAQLKAVQNEMTAFGTWGVPNHGGLKQSYVRTLLYGTKNPRGRSEVGAYTLLENALKNGTAKLKNSAKASDKVEELIGMVNKKSNWQFIATNAQKTYMKRLLVLRDVRKVSDELGVAYGTVHSALLKNDAYSLYSKLKRC